jgi:hypothetical protein
MSPHMPPWSHLSFTDNFVLLQALHSPEQHKSHATPEELVRCTKSITVATAKAVAAGNSCKQEDIIVAANMGRKAISDMLTTCKVTYIDHKGVLCWAGFKTIKFKICYHQQVASLLHPFKFLSFAWAVPQIITIWRECFVITCCLVRIYCSLTYLKNKLIKHN